MIDEADFDGRLVGRHVIEQDARRPTGERFLDFGARSDLDFDRLAGLAGFHHSLADASRESNVIVLDEHRVVEAHAMVGYATGRGGHFFEDAEAGRGFAGVENSYAG